MRSRICLWAFVMLVGAVGCRKSDSGPYVDKHEVTQVTCVNNLKQVGVAFRLWSGDHGDKNPFEVSTNAGGVMELVTARDGLRQNDYLIFQVMSNELKAPLLLICPQDKTKQPAKDWASLSESNVSYVCPATSDVLAVCPIDGNTLHADGSVTLRNQ